MIKAAIFDFDGTIIDTEMPAYLTWCEIFHRYNVELPLEVWMGCVGGGTPFDPVGFLEERIGGSVDRNTIEQERNRIYLERVHLQPLRSDIVAYLLDAKKMGLKTGVASSSSRQWVTTHLQHRGLLTLFDVIKTREDVDRVKPDPALFQAVMDEFGIEGEEGIVFEDSRNGLLAAKAAGLYCIVSPGELTKHLDFREADFVLTPDSGPNLPTLIEQLSPVREEAAPWS